MPRLEMFLLGMPQIRVDGAAFPGLASHKARALLLYLALTKQQHARQTLAGLFWGEMSESNARRNLRVTLTKLKAELGEFLLVRRRTLAINPDADIWLDVAEFEKCLAPAEPTLAQLQRAADLYGGHFLDGFYLREAPMFEDWIRPLQERYRQMAMETLYRLAVYHTQQKQYGTGIDYAGRLLTLEPWMEEAHRQMMLLQALSGQRSTALAQYETCRVMLADELGVEPAEATTNLYEQILNEELGEDLTETAVSFPTPLPVSPFQAPAQSPHFVGRLTLLNDLATALTSAKRVHALVGMGGIGKSTLAVQLAHIVRSSFTDGVLWAQAATAEPMAILESWAQAYGYDFTRIGDVESMAAAFRGVLADKSVLIVLDDVRSMARIRPLLPNGKQNQVLITTRNQDLARSLNAQVWPLQELSPENGRLLLTGILGESRTGDEPDATAEICDLLENHPLAVEITAQRLKSRPRRRLSDMAQRLRDEKQRLTLLAISDREVRASFAVSWQALDAAHRRVFALLGLFNGRSFTAEAIAHIADLDQYTTEDRLFALTALSLIREEGKTRYSQHPLLADFAREQLGEDVGKENGRFTDYYLHFAQQHQHDYDALRPEWENLSIAIQTAYHNHNWQTIINFADALQDAWLTRARYAEARSAYQKIENAAQELQNSGQLIDCYLNWGLVCIEQNDLQEAKQLLDKGLKIAESTLDKHKAASIYLLLSRIAFEKNEFSQSQELLNKCELLLQETKELTNLSSVYYRRARIFVRQGEYKKAIILCKKTLSMEEKAKDTYGILKIHYLLTHIFIEEKEYELAKFHCQKAIKLSEELSRKEDYAMSLDKMATINRRLGDFALAYSNAQESLKVFEQIGSRKFQGLALYTLSVIKEDLKQFDESLDLGLKSLSLLDQVNDEFNIAIISIHIGDIYYQLDSIKQCHYYWEKAQNMLKAIGNQKIITQIQEKLSKLPA